jgi:hypothetical protein
MEDAFHRSPDGLVVGVVFRNKAIKPLLAATLLPMSSMKIAGASLTGPRRPARCIPADLSVSHPRWGQ